MITINDEIQVNETHWSKTVDIDLRYEIGPDYEPIDIPLVSGASSAHAARREAVAVLDRLIREIEEGK